MAPALGKRFRRASSDGTAAPVMSDTAMNTLKMGQAGHAASSPEGAGDSLIDRAAQHSCEALAIARDAREHTTRSMETFPGLQARAKPQSLRVAIKVRGKILFVNLRDVVSVQAKVNACVSNGTRVPIYYVSLFRGGRKARNPWIHPHPPICAREHLVCRRNQAAFDGRILPANRGRQGIYRHT